MRTTITLDPDVELLVRRAMERKGVGFKQAVNEGLRKGLGQQRKPFRTEPFDFGGPFRVDVTKALRLAAELEGEEIVRKMAEGR